MNDEIKETLEYKIDFLTKSLNIGIPTKSRRYFNDIKNYITNLQKEKEDYKSRVEKASEDIKDIFKDEKWYENYEYNDLENALKNVLNRLQNESENNE